MKKLLFLLFTPLLLGQTTYLPSYGDTTDLKASTHCGVVLLEQYGGNIWDVTGGGLFHCIDSTYEEGTHAFNHVQTGKQWARIGAFGTLSATAFSTTTMDAAGDITLENDEYIDNSTDGDVFFVYNDDDDSLGQFILQSSIDTPNVADNDHVDLVFQANDDSSGMTTYASIIVTATDVSDESEDSKVEIKTFSAGSVVTPFTITSNKVTATIDYLSYALHTKVVGDSALGRVFLDAADTTLKAGTGSDLVTITDLAP